MIEIEKKEMDEVELLVSILRETQENVKRLAGFYHAMSACRDRIATALAGWRNSKGGEQYAMVSGACIKDLLIKIGLGNSIKDDVEIKIEKKVW